MTRIPEAAREIRLVRCPCGRCGGLLVILLDEKEQVFAVAPLSREAAGTFGVTMIEAAKAQPEDGLRVATCMGSA